jgi:hypothetical protein
VFGQISLDFLVNQNQTATSPPPTDSIATNSGMPDQILLLGVMVFIGIGLTSALFWKLKNQK